MKKQENAYRAPSGLMRGRERRAHNRVLVDLEVDYACDENFLFAYITDISCQGIFVRTTKPEPTGTRLNLRFDPGDGPEMNLEGQVMWVNSYRPGDPDNINPGMGIQFLELDPVDYQRIKQLIRTFAFLDDEDDTLGHS